MGLRIRIRQTSSVPLEVEGLIPEALAQLSLKQIEQLKIFHGNASLSMAEFFDVDGDPSDEFVCWEGDLTGVHWIGTKMTRGSIRIEGNVGRHVGSEMRGGRIDVGGNVSDWVGAEMRGGEIVVAGSAGHLTGSAYRGSRRGMNGGTIVIRGNAGNEIGHTMRRGLIVIGGSIGDLAGMNMRAGTILVFGDCGIRHGAGMSRGTIGLWGPQRPTLLPSYTYACRMRPPVLSLLQRELDRFQVPWPSHLRTGECDLFHGDMVEGGRGEIWLPAIA